MDRDGLVDSYNEDANDDDDNDDDHHGDGGGLNSEGGLNSKEGRNSEGGLYEKTSPIETLNPVDEASCVFVDETVDEITIIDAITVCEDNGELAMPEGEKKGELNTEGSDAGENKADDEGEEDNEEACDDWEDEVYEEDEDDEEETTLYHHSTYPTEVFQNLEDFRHSSLLIDLTLSTQDGHTVQAHSPVVAAVSSLIQQKLRMQSEWSHSDIHVCLGPEVTHFGLAAVLDFAYTGSMPTLCKDTMGYIQTAAHAMGAQRVLDLCKLKEEEEEKKKRKEEEEEKKKKKEEEEEEEEKNEGENNNEEDEKREEEEDEKEEGKENEEDEENKDKKIKENEKEGEEETYSLSASEELEITLQSIRDLWVEKVGCDIVLQADGQPFHAHRVVLAASSDYFHGMFTSGMKETRQWGVTLHSLGDEELDAFLLCFYSGSLVLSWGWVFDLICAAFQFQVKPVLSLCLDFLHQEIDAHSCLDVASFAEAYGMWDLLQFADDFVVRHFKDVSTTPKFQDLSSYKLLRYMKSNALCVPSEIVVLRAVMYWAGANPIQRADLAREFIDAIKFPLLIYEELEEFNEAEAIPRWPQQSMRNLYHAMFEEFFYQEVDKKPKFRDYLPKGNLVLVGGEGITHDMGNRKPSGDLWFSNALRNHTGTIKEVKWKFLGEMPETTRFCHEVAVLEDKLYVCGGRDFYGQIDILKSMFRYDPFDNTWKRLADMQVGRCQFSMVVFDRMIYVMGGERASNFNVDSVERYCPNTDSWSFVRPLDQPMSSHAASVWRGDIYVSGGYNCEYQCLVSMFRYHPERGTTYLADMPHSRAQHRMECVGGYLYIIGGVCSAKSGGYIDDLSCQVYSPESDFWCSIPPLPLPHVGAASAVLEDKVYILGGYCQADYGECNFIHRYDPDTECWEYMGEMPGPISDIRACRLHLPDHFRK
ncbi:hypothetical protein AALO_G00300680 [Alosa alosa]|uniref:BTB domain-containing protein n=1 Tax=Alosa alosa TaxID=278164 RepID=A0AAV6FHN7_9TELE|nr:kelch-like protein 33 [Alosa alosa]KAG5261156.1 hypothetical protein AALO_G00300680 [Alosa alosa]